MEAFPYHRISHGEHNFELKFIVVLLTRCSIEDVYKNLCMTKGIVIRVAFLDEPLFCPSVDLYLHGHKLISHLKYDYQVYGCQSLNRCRLSRIVETKSQCSQRATIAG